MVVSGMSDMHYVMWKSVLSERTWQSQDMLGHIGKNQVGGNGRHLVQPCFTELALDVVFIGKAESAMELQAGIGGFPGRVSRQQFGHIGLRTARLMGVVQSAGLKAHQAGGLYIDVRAGDGKLDTLILSDRAVEYDAFFCIGRYFVDEPVPIAYAFRCNQCAFSIQAV